jgi:hypothetical protein
MRARPLLALVVALGFALSGCGGGGEDDPAATLPPVTPTASPTEAAADVPDEAREATPEGAVAFASYYAMKVFEAYMKRDAARLKPLSEPGCETCNRYVGTIEALIEDDAAVGDAYAVEVLDAVSPALEADAATARVTVFLRIGEFVVTGPTGQELAREPQKDQVVQDFTLTRTGDAWRVAEIVTS